MRKFTLVSALLLASASAQAGETRSLSLAGIPTVTTTAASDEEAFALLQAFGMPFAADGRAQAAA